MNGEKDNETTGDEQPANNESSNENISSPILSAEAEQYQTLNLPTRQAGAKPTTEDMEVHKHPHHVTHKKKWGEYLLEFFMLFLAVFLGFLAENIREHVVENDRAKEFSKSLLQDLQDDTSAINVEKKTAESYIAVADSLLKLSKTQLEGRNAAEFAFYTRFTYWTVPISWNHATFEQIKNSGSLRYFKDQQLLKKMLEYDGLVNEINAESNANSIRGNMLLPLLNTIIEPEFHYEASKYFLWTLDTMSIEMKEHFFSYKTESLENKRDKIRELLNMVVVQQRNLRLQFNGRWQQAQALAVELINDIKKEYHLE